MVRKHGHQSLAVDTFERLQGSILAGTYRAGQRLLPADLAAEHGVSTSVIREALIRLSERDLVEVAPNRGFTVTKASPDRLRDLIEVRVINETAALRMSIERGDLEWESSVVAAHHRLASLGSRPEEFERWFAAHLEFHEQLISGSGNSILTKLCGDLLRTGDLYVRWLIESTEGATPLPTPSNRAHTAEHQAILNAVLARDAELAAALYRAHLQLTGTLIATAHTPAAELPPTN
ncbi:GntR family transcriptional regulator [Mycolicibacterium sp. CBM1]